MPLLFTSLTKAWAMVARQAFASFSNAMGAGDAQATRKRSSNGSATCSHCLPIFTAIGGTA